MTSLRSLVQSQQPAASAILLMQLRFDQTAQLTDAMPKWSTIDSLGAASALPPVDPVDTTWVADFDLLPELVQKHENAYCH